MTDNDYKDLVITHDKHIDLMASSIENLATAVGSTNTKLDDIIGVMGTQNVLVERMNNMDINIKEYVDRMQVRVEAIEHNQNVTGCSTLKESNILLEQLEGTVKEEKLKILSLEQKVDKFVSADFLKWVAAGTFSLMIMFGSYIIKDTNLIKKELISSRADQHAVNTITTKDINRLNKIFDVQK